MHISILKNCLVPALLVLPYLVVTLRFSLGSHMCMYTFCNASYLIQLTICLLIAYICQVLIICIMILQWLACSFGINTSICCTYMLLLILT